MLTLFSLLKNLYRAVLCLLSLTLVTGTVNAQDVLTGFTSNGGSEGRGTAFSISSSGTNFSVIKPFADWGNTPNGSLLEGVDGNFYGMTSDGGTFNHTGTIFMMTPAGKIKILKQLNGITEGAYPHGELIKGTDGNFYGMCSSGGENNYGTIFKINTAGTFTLIKSLIYSTEGANPRGHLVQAKDGNFYGITYGGGANGYGTIFRLTPGGTYTVLRSMNKPTDGGNCYGSLTEGKDGSLYGITYGGGSLGYGTIFKITTGGVFTVLRNLNGATDGGSSESDLIQATDGNFYGMTYSGGINGNGTVFKITSGSVFTVLKSFASSKDGGSPYGNLVQHTDGSLYGMTRTGTSGNAGGIFKITTGAVYTQLHSFVEATEGATANGSLISAKDGNLYGLASTGGAMRGGTAFKVTTGGIFTLLASFNGASAGNAPYDSPVKGKDSAYYGTTYTGGTYGHGTIFKICGGSTSVLFSFNRNVTGGFPQGSLIQATDGYFYGATTDGGTNGAGTIFRITPGGTFTILRHLTSSTDGADIQGSLVQGRNGLLYGMTGGGGAKAGGTIFKMTLGGTYTVLRALAYATDGANPEGSLVQGSGNDSNFYGMAANGSKAFKISPAGTFTVLHNFLSTNEGSYPFGSFTLGKDGYLYGLNSSGGLYGGGTIFKMSTAGTVTVLKHLNAVPDGKMPKGSLLQGTDGNLYGMASSGGTNNAGTLFKITTGGTFTVLRHFNLITDGGAPFGSLILAPKSSLIANAQTVNLMEDSQKSITLTGSGGSTLSYTITNAPKYGTLSGTTNVRTYIPNRNFNGSDQFGFRVSVGCMVSPVATVNLTVTPVADTPVLAAIGAKTVTVNTTLHFTAAASDADAGQALKFSLTGAPAGASINASTGLFTWKPTAAGTFSFKVRVTDNGSPALFDEETISVKVNAAAFATMTKAGIVQDNIAGATLYPNPVKNRFYITPGLYTGKVTICILSLNGTVLSNSQYDNISKSRIEMNAAQLKAGSYLLQVQSAAGSETIKFIKE